MTLSRPSFVFMKCKADKSEHHQDGSSYHQPYCIAEPPSRSSFLRLQPRYAFVQDSFSRANR
jgi:hypothetical protein